MWKEKQHIKECWKLLAVTLLQILERIAKVAENFKRGGKLLFGCLVVWLVAWW